MLDVPHSERIPVHKEGDLDASGLSSGPLWALSARLLLRGQALRCGNLALQNRPLLGGLGCQVHGKIFRDFGKIFRDFWDAFREPE